MTTLVGVARRRAAAGLIDPLTHLRGAAAYLYRGARDSCYQPGSVGHAAEFYERVSARVHFADSAVPSLHAIPTVADGTPCGTEGNYSDAAPHGLEACGYDGAGECLSHIYPGLTAPTAPQDPGSLVAFDQREFRRDPLSGLDAAGWAYIPQGCRRAGARCRVHVFAHGCGMSAASGPAPYAFGDTYARRAGFNAWAEANGIVVLYPQLHFGAGAITSSQRGDCWDQEGNSGDDFSDKGGAQVRAVKAMVDRLTSAAAAPPPPS